MNLRVLPLAWLVLHGAFLSAADPALTEAVGPAMPLAASSPRTDSIGGLDSTRSPDVNSDSLKVQTVRELTKLSLEELLAIQVTSVLRSPVALADAPSALQVVTSRDIERSGATRISEALRPANNLNVAQKNSHDWAISARGFNTDLANKLLVLIDGRTVYTPLFSGVRWDVQDYLLEDIDRIEVISGPGGALWGANAVNGVINVTTKSAKDTQGLYGEIGGGNQLREYSSLRYGGSAAPNVHYRIYGKHARRAGEVLASGATVNDDSNFNQGGFRLDAETAAQGKVTVQGDYYEGTEGMPAAGDSRVCGGNVVARWSQILPNGSDVSVQAYYDRTYLRQPFAAGPFGGAGYFTEDLGTYDLDFQHKFAIGDDQRFVWGLGCRFTDDETKDAPALGFDPRALRQNLFSGFVQHQSSIGPGVHLTVGTKLEHNDYTGVEFEPSLRVQKELSDNQMIWGAISRAVRMPSRIDHDILQPSAGRTILGGGKDFRSETLVAYETGYRGQLGSRLIGSVALFYNRYNNIRSLRPTPGTFLPLLFANDLEGETHGLEVAVSSDLTSWWRVNAGYTLLRAHLRIRPGGVDLNNALNETSDPQNQLSLGSSMDLPRGIALDAQLRWVDTLQNNRNGSVGTVPSYADLNVRLGFVLSAHLELSLVGQNLLHDQHPEFGIPDANRVEISRSIFAKLAWHY